MKAGNLKVKWQKIKLKTIRRIDKWCEKYREKEVEKPYLPKTKEDLVWLLKKMPESVLTKKEKEMIGTAMSWRERKIREIMTLREQVPFVKAEEVLGPLVLDRLYQSGWSYFPVAGENGEVVGVINTHSLNSLEVREAEVAEKYLDEKVCYMREDYNFEQAMAAFMRTNCYFALVVNRTGRIVGALGYEMMMRTLIGEVPEDGFSGDLDKQAVMGRRS